jgi:hypothetical protein
VVAHVGVEAAAGASRGCSMKLHSLGAGSKLPAGARHGDPALLGA